jgi:hypothetical protein
VSKEAFRPIPSREGTPIIRQTFSSLVVSAYASLEVDLAEFWCRDREMPLVNSLIEEHPMFYYTGFHYEEGDLPI